MFVCKFSLNYLKLNNYLKIRYYIRNLKLNFFVVAKNEQFMKLLKK